MRLILAYASYFFLALSFLPFLAFLPARKTRKIFMATHTVAIIAAHNEEKVIGDIISDCLKAAFDEIILIADACTDGTVALARQLGVTRILEVAYHSKTQALHHCWAQLTYGQDNAAVLFFFDADNRIKNDFLARALPSFYSHNIVQFRIRNKNSASWISRMYIFNMALYIATQKAMQRLGLTATIGGTGWGIRSLIAKHYPFVCETVVDDMEYTMRVKEKVYFTTDAEVEDEKPTNFFASYRQRIRWTRGSFQLLFSDWRNYDYKKLYMLIITSISKLYVITCFLFARFPHTWAGWGSYFFLLFAFSTLIIIPFLDTKDLQQLKLYDFLIAPLFGMTFYPITFWSLLTYKTKKWYRTPHSGVRDVAKNME